jgi:RNase adapter protein RapZ
VKKLRLIVVSGLSGAGKSYTIKCLEDMGFFCVDNLPPSFLPKFVELCLQPSTEIRRVALGVDIREREFLSEFLVIFDKMRHEGYAIDLLFLEAGEEVLVRRFSESRRPHPLAKDRPVIEGIRMEKIQLQPLRDRSDQIIDTSFLSLQQLKEVLTKHYLEQHETKRLQLTLISFGYKYGIPFDADLLFDARFLRNPQAHLELRSLSGEDPKVVSYVLNDPAISDFLQYLTDLLCFLIPLYEKDGRSYLTISIGCTGGRHRSVAVVNELANRLQSRGHEVSIRHRDIQRG